MHINIYAYMHVHNFEVHSSTELVLGKFTAFYDIINYSLFVSSLVLCGFTIYRCVRLFICNHLMKVPMNSIHIVPFRICNIISWDLIDVKQPYQLVAY